MNKLSRNNKKRCLFSKAALSSATRKIKLAAKDWILFIKTPVITSLRGNMPSMFTSIKTVLINWVKDLLQAEAADEQQQEVKKQERKKML